MEDIKKILSDNIKRLRSERKWSQTKLGEILGASDPDAEGAEQAYISQIETGTRWPRPETLKRLAEAFGVSQSELFADPSDVAARPTVPDQLAAIARQAAREAIQEANRDTAALTARIAELEAEIAKLKAEKDEQPQAPAMPPEIMKWTADNRKSFLSAIGNLATLDQRQIYSVLLCLKDGDSSLTRPALEPAANTKIEIKK